MPRKKENPTPFVRWLQIEILRSGLTQGQLAFHAGIHPNTISKYMSSECVPRLDTFRFLCDALAFHQINKGFSKQEIKVLSDMLVIAGIRNL
tara:strand:+ start:2012 stop:2287 length:276 start_codon:yes stop_codon:yes gene_type:complete